MKRVSIYVMFAVCAWSAIVIHDFFFYRSTFIESYEKRFAHQVSRLSTEALVANAYYKERGRSVDELVGYLEDRRLSYDIDFWVVEKAGGTERGGPIAADFQFEPSTAGDQIRRYSNVYYTTIDVDPAKRVVVGKLFDREEFLKIEYASGGAVMIRYLINLSLITLAAFAFFFRDISKSIRALTQGGLRSYRDINVNSKEADLLVRGFAAYDEQARGLERDKEMLSHQVLPSLQTELASGRKPPYDFTCTLVRTDINNFSKIYNEFPVDAFTSTINDFFTDVSHAIARYDGLIHEFIGDEVIYYFKDQKRAGDSIPMALSAIRDVNEIASRYSRMTLEERGYPFTVKSSFAEGSLRFGRFVNGYGIAGPSLIETVRVLSQVAEKDGNVVICDQRHLPELSGIADFDFYAEVRLKGFQDTKRLLVYRGHKPIAELFDHSQASTLLPLLRGDGDQFAILKHAHAHAELGDFDSALKLVLPMRSYRVTKANGEPQTFLIGWISELVQQANPKANRLLATAIHLVDSLIPPELFPDELDHVLRKAMTLTDRRVVANTLEVLTIFGRDSVDGLESLLANHRDNRVAANALIREGCKAMTPLVVRRLQRMIACAEALQMASAFYAIGEIAAFHRRRDIVYFNTSIDFVELIQQLPAYVFHEDASVRRQSMTAARKSEERQTLQTICASLSLEQNHRFAAEAREYLGSFYEEPVNKNAA